MNNIHAQAHEDHMRSIWPEAATKTQLRIGHRVTRRAKKRLSEKGLTVEYEPLLELYADMLDDGDFESIQSENTRVRLLVETWIREET